MLGATAGASGFEPVIGRIVVNEVVHFCRPFLFASCIALAWHDSVLSLLPEYLFVGDEGAAVPAPIYEVICGTNSSRCPPILLINHVLMHAVAGA